MDNIINIQLAGSFLRADSNVLGIQGEANSKKLTIHLNGAWVDCSAITAFFDDADGAAAAQVFLINADPSKGGNLIADATYQIGVPPEALRSPGKAQLTIKGYNDQHNEIRKAFKRFEVIENHAVYPASSEPTPTLAEQLVNLITGAFRKLFCKPVNINPENNHWMIWNPNTEQYEDSGISSVNIVDASGNLVTGSITTAYLADKSVTSAKLADSAVTAGKISDGAVTVDKISKSSVINSKIADNAVTTNKIADRSVTRAKLTADLAGMIPNVQWDGYTQNDDAEWVLVLGGKNGTDKIQYRLLPNNIVDQVNNNRITVSASNGWLYQVHEASGRVIASGSFDLGSQSLPGPSDKISAAFSVPLPITMYQTVATINAFLGERGSTYGGITVHSCWCTNDRLYFQFERVNDKFSGFANVSLTAFICGQNKAGAI